MNQLLDNNHQPKHENSSQERRLVPKHIDGENTYLTYVEEEDEYVVEGPKIEKMLGYTNLDSEKGFTFFQNFLAICSVVMPSMVVVELAGIASTPPAALIMA